MFSISAAAAACTAALGHPSCRSATCDGNLLTWLARPSPSFAVCYTSAAHPCRPSSNHAATPLIKLCGTHIICDICAQYVRHQAPCHEAHQANCHSAATLYGCTAQAAFTISVLLATAAACHPEVRSQHLQPDAVFALVAAAAVLVAFLVQVHEVGALAGKQPTHVGVLEAVRRARAANCDGLHGAACARAGGGGEGGMAFFGPYAECALQTATAFMGKDPLEGALCHTCHTVTHRWRAHCATGWQQKFALRRPCMRGHPLPCAAIRGHALPSPGMHGHARACTAIPRMWRRPRSAGRSRHAAPSPACAATGGAAHGWSGAPNRCSMMSMCFARVTDQRRVQPQPQPHDTTRSPLTAMHACVARRHGARCVCVCVRVPCRCTQRGTVHGCTCTH
eukprot:351938-Chlamydomonas_euryale.AAC.9